MSLCNGPSDKFIIVNKDTPKEKIEELKLTKMRIVFIDDEDGSYYDEVGGFHSAGMGWNPHGIWCGECSNDSCENCPCKDNKEGIR
jgi:hypothetical protein